MYIKFCDFLMGVIVRYLGTDVYLNTLISFGLYLTVAPSLICGVILAVTAGLMTGVLSAIGMFVVLWLLIFIAGFVLSRL